MNNEFIDNAFKIRNKHFKMTQGILSNGNSTYNSQKIKEDYVKYVMKMKQQRFTIC